MFLTPVRCSQSLLVKTKHSPSLSPSTFPTAQLTRYKCLTNTQHNVDDDDRFLLPTTTTSLHLPDSTETPYFSHQLLNTGRSVSCGILVLSRFHTQGPSICLFSCDRRLGLCYEHSNKGESKDRLSEFIQDVEKWWTWEHTAAFCILVLRR